MYNPLEDQDLKTELQMRGVETTGKKTNFLKHLKNFSKESTMCLPFSSQIQKHFWITCTLTGMRYAQVNPCTVQKATFAMLLQKPVS